MSQKRKFSRKSKQKVVIHDDGEGNWLISYADLMTLLWGFFVILSAFSVPNQELLEKLKESTAKSMGGEYKNPFNELSDRLKNVLKELNLENDAIVETLSDGVKLTMKATNFFDSGRSDLKGNAKKILLKIGTVLIKENGKFQVLVEGHTDDVPIKTKHTPSNWELSADRASTVVRLFEGQGVAHNNLRPIGLADVDPLIDIKKIPKSELKNARAKNRRIVIRLQKIIPKRMSRK